MTQGRTSISNYNLSEKPSVGDSLDMAKEDRRNCAERMQSMVTKNTTIK